MKRSLLSLSALVGGPTRRLELWLAILCALGAALAMLTLPTGCASTSAGLAREQAVYRAGTNVVAQAESLLPFVPAPVATPVEVVLGLISAGLGAWNLHQQKSIKKLKNGGANGNGNGKAAPPTPNLPLTSSLAQPAGSPPTASP